MYRRKLQLFFTFTWFFVSICQASTFTKEEIEELKEVIQAKRYFNPEFRRPHPEFITGKNGSFLAAFAHTEDELPF